MDYINFIKDKNIILKLQGCIDEHKTTMIDFHKDKTIIDDTWDDDFIKIEVSSEQVYQFMKEWTDKLIEWRKSQNL